ncbi:MAG TPA: methionine--tRNA ligase [Victivallales bacterium]|nr:methionine--tRNA ligase [Victivallales bacterium]HRR05865.1 methionine--tRNA ligase [Victivallales bacterium]HRR29540.1 methionine--tRNA ligase [Victivallales bacterium]HRU01791.1 methionine--tRNA ligase [Victivallales bacterium]
MKKFYITTPIYYVNDKPHIGHSYTTILADVLARYHRLFGDEVFFLTGTDEHGQKVQKAAEQNKITPQDQCNLTVPRYLELWKKLEITNDDFIRTTEDRHKNVVREILSDLYKKDLIYRADYKGWYCVPCERFFTDKDLDERKLCPECGRPTEELVESNYFFKMGQYQDWLIDYINKHPKFIQPDFRRNETLGFLKKKLDDLCISRPKKRLSWGIELPFDKEYVCYVWFDALINYISAIGYKTDSAKFSKWWPANYHLIGKDILTTHTVYWPIMLKAIGLELPETIFAHGWWLSGLDKMSKSLGNVVNPMDMIDKYGVDAFRYFLMAEMVLGNDASFTEDSFINRYNSELANDLGNLLSRIIKMIVKNRNSTIPHPDSMQPEDEDIKRKSLDTVLQVVKSIEEMKIDKGLSIIFTTVRSLNKYFEQSAPWKLIKEGNEKRLNTVLYCSAEALRITSGLLYPVMPGKISMLRKAIGFSQKENPTMESLSNWGGLKPGMRVQDINSLFPRAELKTEQADKFQTKNSSSGVKIIQEKSEDLITIEEFSRIKLKTAKVLSAEKIEGADKLLKLQVDLGETKRQIVAGIAKFYKPEELIGKNIVIVANLKPAKIRGIESNGMLLAAKTEGYLKLLIVDDESFPAGANIG